ncbi:MAG: DUF4405 domain-containing protein [Schwartzia sp.]|nr:DUF4405 domain-containing protein [Schwartzia sp. (in: firmicutes)]
MMKRIGLDVLLFGLLIFLMCFKIFPRRYHEALGVVIALPILLHLVWNRLWFSSLRRGKWSAYRKLSAAVDILLIVSTLVALVSGAAIAHRIFKGIFGLAWQKSIFVHQLHITSSYWMLLFSGLHLGLHWKALWTRFALWRGWDVSSRCYRLGARLAVAAVVVFGVVGSFLHQAGDRLFMEPVFFRTNTPARDLPPTAFLLLFIAMFGMYAVVGYWAGRKLTHTVD